MEGKPGMIVSEELGPVLKNSSWKKLSTPPIQIMSGPQSKTKK